MSHYYQHKTCEIFSTVATIYNNNSFQKVFNGFTNGYSNITYCKSHHITIYIYIYLDIYLRSYLSRGRLTLGCLGQRLLKVKSFRTIFWAFPRMKLVLASNWLWRFCRAESAAQNLKIMDVFKKCSVGSLFKKALNSSEEKMSEKKRLYETFFLSNF